MLINIKEILKNKKIRRIDKTNRPVNEKYNQALLLEEKFKLNFTIFLRLMKKYSFKEISNVYSWWADYPVKEEVNVGLLVWKLKELYPGR